MKEKYREELNQHHPHSVPTMRQQQALARREQIIEAAVRLFAQYGFDGTSTRQIAREVNITEGLIFHYFPSKADLLTAVLETPHSFLGELSTILIQDCEQPASPVLSRIANEWLSTLRREAAFTTFLLGTAQTNAQVGGILQTLIQQGMSSLVIYLKGRVQQGELRADLPLETCAHMFFSSLIIFFMNCRSLPDVEWEARATTFTQELALVWLTGARR
ncbi:MAG: TetR/AcrR family transcriptional regulator [Chloroflexi bacterium]|nr:TetR/AcrR family transcriptional regulator [Chloroflexota bacterium]